MQYVFIIIILFTSLCQAGGTPTSSTMDANMIKTALMGFFDSYLSASENQKSDVLNQMLGNPDPKLANKKLSYPGFPRMWLEISHSEPTETSTTWGYDTAKIASAINTITGPIGMGTSALSSAAKAISTSLSSTGGKIATGGVFVNYSNTTTINYAYNYKTTFMAMSSLKPYRPDADANQNQPIQIPEGQVSTELQPLVIYKKNLRRTFLNVTKSNPIVGMCKYELTLRVSENKDKTLSFLAGSDSSSSSVVDENSYAIFSDLFEISPDYPVQEYLRERCMNTFTEAIRLLAEQDFNNMMFELFAHYHPQAQCQWTPELPPDPRGDATCMDWYNNPLQVMGSYRKSTVPRCVLGTDGIPKCVLRSKPGANCPVYEYNGRLTDTKPIGASVRQLNPTAANSSIFPCDVGSKCKVNDGSELMQYSIGDNYLQKLWTRNTGVLTTCQASKKNGGKTP